MKKDTFVPPSAEVIRTNFGKVILRVKPVVVWHDFHGNYAALPVLRVVVADKNRKITDPLYWSTRTINLPEGPEDETEMPEKITISGGDGELDYNFVAVADRFVLQMSDTVEAPKLDARSSSVIRYLMQECININKMPGHYY